jgi:VWFA-related protein
LFLLIALPLFAMVSFRAQDQAQNSPSNLPTVKSKVSLVLIDVVVTNAKGESVPSLHNEDFEVSEDGKAQTVTTFEEHHGAPLSQVKLPALPPHVYTNFPVTQTTDSVNVLLLDALNTPMRDQNYVHTQMIKYLKTIPPGTRMAIFTLASRLNMLQGITSDSSELLAILNNSKAGPQPSDLLASKAETDSNRRLVDFMAENGPGVSPETLTMTQSAVDPVNVMKQFLADTGSFQTESRVRITLQALDQLARYLSGHQAART